MTDSAGRKPATRLVHGGRRREWTGGIVNPPVWRASTILYDSVAEMRERGRDTHHRLYYGRRGTPTQWSLAEALTELEPGAAGTLLYSSGEAAVTTALLAVLEAGDELLMVDSAYEPTRAFCDGILKRFGVTTRYYDPLSVPEIDERTGAVFLESPGSLTFEVQDVPAICAAARAKGVPTILDNTWATPLLFPALSRGVDISVLACTKYIGGHSDVMLGSATANEDWWPKLRAATYAIGQYAGPDEAWLGARGLRTLQVRLERQETSAVLIAEWLAERPEVARVLHPAFPDCPGSDRFHRDFAGASGLFAFVLDGGDDAARCALLDGLALFGLGYSWGGYESLAVPCDPRRTVTPWQAKGPLVRLSIGLEDPDDLIADLEAGLARFRAFAGFMG